MSDFCAQCGAKTEHPDKYRYCDRHFNEWLADYERRQWGKMSDEEYKEKWK